PERESGSDREAARAAANAGAQAPTRPSPQRPGRPTVPGRPVPQHTAILPPPRRERWYRRLVANPRYLVLAIAGVLIVGGAAAFGVGQLASEDGGGAPSEERRLGQAGGDAGGDGNEGRRRRGGGVTPANVTVAVLNGTTVPGLAASISDKAEAEGFETGTVADFTPNQQLAESVVQYTPGHERDAAAVGRRLGITQREAISPSSQSLAGDAAVVVIAGADQAP
ncbi:MAG: LytR C-terminal domain-containing protein, partial [Thermoleophilaceae bacterium]